MKFIHLHVHNEHSLLDGVGTAEDYAAEAKRLGQESIALTNHGNCDGVIKFQKACKKQGIIPILGCELYLCSDIKVKDDQRFHIIALVQSREGLTNLLHMLSVGNIEGFYRRPRVDPATLLQHTQGLVFTTACVSSFVHMKGGEDLLVQLSKQTSVFMEIMPHDHPKQKEHNQKILSLATRHHLPVVATNDCHYPYRGGGSTQDVLLAIQRKAKWSDPNRWSMSKDWPGLHLRSAAEMEHAFKKQNQLTPKVYLAAMERTLEVAQLCNNYTIEKLPVQLPKVYGHKSEDETELLWQLIEKGWEQRLGDYYFLSEKSKEYEDRVNEEFALICQQGFQRYFLIVHEIINWCKTKGIMTGPGRGSVGGSLIAYLLGITNVDPIVFGLIFARFISPERQDLPDIDLDFQDSRREEVVQHIKDCYGEYNVANISTFMTMKGRGALRDTARVFDVPLNEVDVAAKALRNISDEKSEHTIEDNLKVSKELSQFNRTYPQVVKYAMQLEGQVKGYGRHAAGLCVCNYDLRRGDCCSLRIYNGALSVSWDKEDAEYMGLMKFDVLGLTALSILNGAREFILTNQNIDLDFDKIPLDDKKVFAEIAQGNTIGGFQLGTALMVRLCKELKIKEFNDIVLVNALSRPGPLGSGVTDEFIERRKGQKRITYIHKKLESYTRETLGMIIYQEQVMWAMYELAGLSWAECDKVRKVMGKSKGTAAFQEFKQKFVDGCISKRTLQDKEAEHVWDQLATFGSYGFNKCVSGDTVVERGARGKYGGMEMTVRELYDNWNSKKPVGEKYRSIGVNILQLNKDGRIRPGKVKGIYYQGKRKTYLVKTKNGCSLRVTDNHKFPTDHGDKTLSELTIEDSLIIRGEKFYSIKEEKKKLSSRCLGKTYSGCGFQNRENNISWNGGIDKYFKDAKKLVEKRAKGRCENCGKQITKKCSECGSTIKLERCEFAHIRPLDDFLFNYKLYHSTDNLLHLCNSCHKTLDYAKQERKVRHSQGRVSFYDRIVSIVPVGIEDVYDIEMEGPDHNFVANGIVVYNSHAVEYSLIGYWTMYCRVHFPKEFLCACLTWGGKDEARAYVDEARRLGLTVELPKAGVSLPDRWLGPKDQNVIWASLTSIKGIGESQATKVIVNKPKMAGFFDKELASQPQSQVNNLGKTNQDLLTKAGYYRKKDLTHDELKAASVYYDFNILVGKDRFKRLTKAGYGYSKQDDDKIVRCEIAGFTGNLIEVKKFVLPKFSCTDCILHKEATAPVQPSFGRYNLMIIGEAPGPNEDEEGVGFVGKAGGRILWPELAKYGMTPYMFHVSNLCKCWPSKTKTPDKTHISACSKHLMTEIKGLEPIVILVFAKTGVEAFRNGDGKITELNGTTEWSDLHQCWICWCIHPASVLYSGGNREKFEAGIANFVRTVTMAGGMVWANGGGPQVIDENFWMDCPSYGNFAEDNNAYAECGVCKVWERCALAKAKSDWQGVAGKPG